jgi:sulfatase maturation enzyme AslB (radical SAM superfamily)
MSTTAVPPRWSTDRQITRRGVLWLGLSCDVRCKFCYDELVASREKAWMPADEARAALDRFRFFYRNEFVDFMGGEPTLHPQAVQLWPMPPGSACARRSSHTGCTWPT